MKFNSSILIFILFVLSYCDGGGFDWIKDKVKEKIKPKLDNFATDHHHGKHDHHHGKHDHHHGKHDHHHGKHDHHHHHHHGKHHEERLSKFNALV